MEVSQAIWLTMFFGDALLISPKRFDEIILDFYQDAGIWIVIASCVAEYLLLLTYIGVAAYDFFKNRKMMKKMNVQRRTYEFLKFDESHRDVGNRLIRLSVASSKREPSKKTTIMTPTTIASPSSRKRKHAPPIVEKWALNRVRPNRPFQAPNNPQLLKFDGDTRNTTKNISVLKLRSSQ